MANCVIEIDGSQHKKANNKFIDIERDLALSNNNIKVIRIPTSDLKSFNFLTLNPNKSKYNFVSPSNINNKEQNYMALIRYQTLILMLLEDGTLSFNDNWNFEIKQNDSIDTKVFEYAINDTLELIKNISSLF